MSISGTRPAPNSVTVPGETADHIVDLDRPDDESESEHDSLQDARPLGAREAVAQHALVTYHGDVGSC
jgi:hypothetical protein